MEIKRGRLKAVLFLYMELHRLKASLVQREVARRSRDGGIDAEKVSYSLKLMQIRNMVLHNPPVTLFA